MNLKGYISPVQYSTAFNSKGYLTGGAKNDLQGILFESIFQEGSTTLKEKFNSLPAKAQKAILGTAYRDHNSPKEQSIIKDIQSSISAYYDLMQQEDFVNAKDEEQVRRALFAWANSRNIDFATGETFVPSEKYNNFALELVVRYKTESQKTLQGLYKKIFDLIQGTQEETLFEKPDNTPRTKEEAIKQTLNIDYNGKIRSNTLAGNNKTSERGQRGINGTPTSSEQTQSGERTSDNRGRTSENVELVTEATEEAKSQKAFKAVRKAVEKAGLVIHEATPEMVAEVNGNSIFYLQEVENANSIFNEELDGFSKKVHKGLLHLGKPMQILRSIGINSNELTLSPKVLNQHLKKHNLTTEDLKGLAKAIQNPILAYKHGKNYPHIIIVTELDVKGGKISIAVKLDLNGNVVEVSNISSIHNKDANRELERLSNLNDLNESLRWVDKEKVSDWLGLPYMEERQESNPKLFDITNIIKNFENPKIYPEFHLVYHGSGINFDRFDHSYMGSGDGNQAYGYGSYVTEVYDIAKRYAKYYHKASTNLVYSVEIPNDTGSNYLYYEQKVPQNVLVEIKDTLYNLLLQQDEYKGSEKFLKTELDDISDITYEELYGNIASYLGSQKDASKFLKSMGFVGISYPTNYMTTGRQDNARNYVIFDENDLNITEKTPIEFLFAPNSTIYGWVENGEIYLTPEGMNSETLIHEYSHLWVQCVKKLHPQKWEEIKNTLKSSKELWDKIFNYTFIKINLLYNYTFIKINLLYNYTFIKMFLLLNNTFIKINLQYL